MPEGMMPLLERLVVAVESMSHEVKSISGSLNELSVNVYCLLKEKTPADDSSLSHDAEGQTRLKTDKSRRYGPKKSNFVSQSDALKNKRPLGNTASMNLSDGDTVLQVDHCDESDNFSSASMEDCPVLFAETRQFAEKILHSKATSSNFEQSLCSDDQRVYPNEKTCASRSYEQTSRNDSTLSLHGCKKVHRKALNRSSGISFSFTKEPERKGGEENVSEENEEELVEAGESDCVDAKQENTGIHEKGDTQERGKDISSSWSTPSGHHWRQPRPRMPYCCEICGKFFIGNTALENHQRVHTGEKPFKCPLCMRTFSEKGNLVRHMRVHSGEKPFSCNICKKAFSQSQALHIHMRIHSGEKPFLCPECGKVFAFRSGFIKHKHSHSRK